MTVETLPAALRIYDTLRRPFSQDVLRRSRMNGLLYQLNTLGWEEVTSEQSASGGFPFERLAEIGQALRRQFDWSLTTSIMQERQQAIEMAKGLTVQ